MEMANKMLTVQGLQELGHTVIDRLRMTNGGRTRCENIPKKASP